MIFQKRFEKEIDYLIDDILEASPRWKKENSWFIDSVDKFFYEYFIYYFRIDPEDFKLWEVKLRNLNLKERCELAEDLDMCGECIFRLSEEYREIKKFGAVA